MELEGGPEGEERVSVGMHRLKLLIVLLLGDLSSISGSESDSDDELKTTERDDDHGALQGKGADRSPYLHFSSEEGSTHSIYRCIIPGSQSNMEPGHDLGHALQALREPQMWIILMRSGGHFAGAVFKG